MGKYRRIFKSEVMTENIHTLLDQGWKVNAERHLEKLYFFKTFQKALEFTVKVGGIAEQINHHPEITLSFKKVLVELWTHTTQSITEKDIKAAFSFDASYYLINK